MATRIISAIVGIIIALVVFSLSNTIVFYIAISALSIIIIHELFHAENCIKFKFSYFVCIFYVGVMPFMAMPRFLGFRYLFAIICIFVLFGTFLIQHETLTFDKLSFMITISTLISLSMCCLILIKDIDEMHGIFYICLTLGGAWLADGGAYFVGTFLGKHKLFPEISPKKTIEGAIGGIIIGPLIMALGAFAYQQVLAVSNIHFNVNYPLIIGAGVVCAMLSMVGDLTASLLKRQCNIKDYGNIMPGHGGVLDRFDSVLFVAPFMSMVLTYMKVFY